MSEHDGHHVEVPYGLYLKVWLALLGLTAVTVGVSLLDMKQVVVLTAMLIAALKSGLVLLYFMHLRFEKPLFLGMVLAVLVIYGIFIGCTFFDYSFR